MAYARLTFLLVRNAGQVLYDRLQALCAADDHFDLIQVLLVNQLR